MIGVDLFSGAGGMTHGAKLAGIHVVFAVEADPHAASTYAANHPEVNLFCGDIKKLEQIPVRASNQPTVLFGGPPCQGFSTSNQRTRNEANQCNWMFTEFIRLAKSWHPDWIVFENVYGIAGTANGRLFKNILESFRAIGYTLSNGILNAAHFGVPQKRERMFVIGSSQGITIPMPRPKPAKLISVRHAISISMMWEIVMTVTGKS